LVIGIDLVVSSVVAPYDGAKGKTIIVANTVKNQGNKAANSFWVNFYLKKTGSSSPIYIGHRSVASLGAGISNHHHTTLAIPKSVADGNYYILGVVDATKKVAESNEKNNLRYSPTKIIVHNILLPDLTISAEEKIVNNQNVYYITVKNQGKAASPPTKIKWVEASLNIISGDWDYLYSYSAVPALATGATYKKTYTYGYYELVGVGVDMGNFIFESNEKNNWASIW
jgi:subtilase family serine protease